MSAEEAHDAGKNRLMMKPGATVRGAGSRCKVSRGWDDFDPRFYTAPDFHGAWWASASQLALESSIVPRPLGQAEQRVGGAQERQRGVRWRGLSVADLAGVAVRLPLAVSFGDVDPEPVALAMERLPQAAVGDRFLNLAEGAAPMTSVRPKSD